MKYSCAAFLLIAGAWICFGQITDSSQVLFDQTHIHEYSLQFCVTDWASQLEYNYKNGEEYMPAQLTYGNTVLDSIGVRYKGNSSYTMSGNSPKKPFKFRFDKYKDQTFYGLERLNFSNCIKDPSFMREKLGYDIARSYMPAPRTAYANLYIEGDLIGLYVQVEQVDEIFLSRYFHNNTSNLFKASDNGATLLYRGTNSSDYELEYELKTNKDVNDWSAFIDMIGKLNHTPASDFVRTMQSCLDLENCIRHFAFTIVLSHFDSYTGSGRNFYFYDDPVSGQFYMIPWDLNEAFGVYTNNWNVLTQDVINLSNLNQRPLNQKILDHDSLKQAYLDYIREMMHGPASYDSISVSVKQIKSLIDSHVQADPNKFYSYQDFVDNIESDVYIGLGPPIPGIQSFSQQRSANLQSQLAQYSSLSFSQHVNANYSLDIQAFQSSFPSLVTITYSVDFVEGPVRINAYDCRGAFVKALFAGTGIKGDHKILWNTNGAPPGMYVIQIEGVNSSASNKLTLLITPVII